MRTNSGPSSMLTGFYGVTDALGILHVLLHSFQNLIVIQMLFGDLDGKHRTYFCSRIHDITNVYILNLFCPNCSVILNYICMY